MHLFIGWFIHCCEFRAFQTKPAGPDPQKTFSTIQTLTWAVSQFLISEDKSWLASLALVVASLLKRDLQRYCGKSLFIGEQQQSHLRGRLKDPQCECWLG